MARQATSEIGTVDDKRGRAVGKPSAKDAAGFGGPRFSAVLEQLGEGVIVTDAQGQIIFVNRAAVEHHGVKELQVDPDDYSNKYHLFSIDGEPYPSHDLPLARAVRTGECVEDERWLIRRPDGTEILAIGTAKPLFDTSGEQIGAVLTIRDDTARHSAETKLAELNHTLEERVAKAVEERELAEAEFRQSQKMEAVGQLTGGIAHDFNNLLAVILGSLELLPHCAGNEDKRDRHLANIREATERAATLTQRLLAFSRRQPLEPKPTDINKLITEMTDMLERTMGADVEFDIRLDPSLGPVVIDSHQLENALLNLAVNSRDAMPGGGTLAIETTVTCEPPPEVAIECDKVALITIADDGAGIDPAILPHVFEPFFTTKDVGKGTGLGLSMIYGFMKQSGGHVEIESEGDIGTVIRLYLPMG